MPPLSPLLKLPAELARLCATPSEKPTDALPIGLLGLDDALPDGGLPRGSVVELAAPAGLAQATRIALAACSAAQAHSRQTRRNARSCWCAWLDPHGSLYAPGVGAAGVDLARLLVVQPPLQELGRIAGRVVASDIFSLVVVDRSCIEGLAPNKHSTTRWRTATRRLALAASNSKTTVLLLSNTRTAQRDLLPTALRLELRRSRRDQIQLRVAKERRGRVRDAVPLSLNAPSVSNTNGL